MDTATRLFEAHATAQHYFHDMLVAGVYSDPEHVLTRAYVAAERVVDDLLGEAQWNASTAAMDELVAADR